MSKQTQRKLAIVAAALILAACSYTPIYTEPGDPRSEPGSNEQSRNYPPVEEAGREAEEIDKRPPRVAVATPESVDQSRNTETQSRTASDNLRDQAQLASESGDYAKAERILDRALRIAPHEAATYYQLALVKLRQGSPGQALQLARKGLSLRPEQELQQRLMQIEADAEARAGG